jgi:hypothetical protein
MLSSIDGRIDGTILGNVIAGNEYETIGARLRGGTLWLRYRVVRP